MKKQRKVREEFFITFDIFASKAKSAPTQPFDFVTKIILSNLKIEGPSSQFFKLLGRLIEEANNEKVIDLYNLFSQVIERIKSHESTEMKGSPKQDQTLIGLLKTAIKIIEKEGVNEKIIEIADKQSLMSELFNKCLFPDNIEIPTEDVTHLTPKSKLSISGNKCKTEESRK